MALHLELAGLLEQPAALAERVKSVPLEDLVDSFLRMRRPQQARFLESLPAETGASVLQQVDSDTLSRCFDLIDPAKVLPALSQVPPEEIADILLRLEAARRASLLEKLAPDLRTAVEIALSYPEGTVGSVMDPRHVSVPEVVTVARALEVIRGAAPSLSLMYVYVVDKGGVLVGTLSVRALVGAKPGTPVGEVAVREVVSLGVREPIGGVPGAFERHGFLALPVVDDKGRIVGVVTPQKAAEVVRGEERQFVFDVAGVRPARDFVRQVASRIPWLATTILGGVGCALIAKAFERSLVEFSVILMFLPLVMALGEAIGAQMCALVIQKMITGEERSIGRWIAREIGIGVGVAAVCGVLVTALSSLWGGDPRAPWIIGISIVLCVVWATTIGAVLPTVVRRLRANPAVASGPVALAIIDLGTLAVYLGIASRLAIS